jgi:hypothetical protein
VYGKSVDVPQICAASVLRYDVENQFLHGCRAGVRGWVSASPVPVCVVLTRDLTGVRLLLVLFGLCRGHLGGLVGGAVVTWLLGPAFCRTADGRLIDQPPLPQLAFKPASSKPMDGGSSGNNDLKPIE